MLLIFVSAALYLWGFMAGIGHKGWAATLERAGEISLAASLIIFFAIPKKK